MKVLVVGAAGKTGQLVVEKALAAGHEVTAFVRGASDYGKPGVRVAAGDAADRSAMEGAVRGQDAVIDTIGGKTPYKSTTLESSAAASIIAAMKKEGVKRLIVTSMLGVGDSADQTTVWTKLLVSTFLRGTDKDKAAMEGEVEASGLEWVIVRPAILNDDPETGRVRVFDSPDDGKPHKIARADVAAFMVQQLTSGEHLRQAVVIANE